MTQEPPEQQPKKRIIKSYVFGHAFERDMNFAMGRMSLEGTVVDSLYIENFRRADGGLIKGRRWVTDDKREISISPLPKNADKPGLDDIRCGIGKWEGGKKTDLFLFVSGFARNNVVPAVPNGTELVTVNPIMLWPPKGEVARRGFPTKEYMEWRSSLADMGDASSIALFEAQAKQGYNVILPRDKPKRPKAAPRQVPHAPKS